MTEQQVLDLRDQIYRPRHCHVQIGKRILTHKKDHRDPQPYDDKPIRFTLLAACRVAAQYPNAVTIPIGSTNGRK